EQHKNPNKPEEKPAILDITFEDYQPLAMGWVAPTCVIKVNGTELQREKYRNIQADVKLQPDLYDPVTYHKPTWINTD
ncbi:MAG: hypothetical protein ACJ8AP_16595, partial [Gemmatimonadales bacterium]